MFANDLIDTAAAAHEKSDEPMPRSSQTYKPDHELESKIRANARYSNGKKLVCRIDKVTEELYDGISTAVNVMDVAPFAMEARAQDPEDVTLAILLCFPRVAENTIDQLTFEPPGRKRYTTELWPVFVNSTRACDQLLRALAIPVAPTPVYLLELLARWLERCTRAHAATFSAHDRRRVLAYRSKTLRCLFLRTAGQSRVIGCDIGE